MLFCVITEKQREVIQLEEEQIRQDKHENNRVHHVT
jgi:hypothetical protein